MTYIEAILAMSKGKEVRRKSWLLLSPIHMKEHKLEDRKNSIYIPSFEAMVADDWVEVKETVKKEFNVNVFLSLPMNGRSKEETLEDKEEYFFGFKKFISKNPKLFGIPDNVEPIIKLNDMNDDIFERHSGNTRLNNLGISIGNMSFADFIIFSVDYTSARGCYIERQVSRKYKEDFGWRVFIANNYSDYAEVDV